LRRGLIQALGGTGATLVDRERKQFAWWYYFWFLVVLGAISPFFGPLDLTDWAFWAFDIIGLVGLWAYLRRRPIISRHLWSAYFLAAVAISLYYSVTAFTEETEFLALFIGVCAVALAISFPLFLALWRYAFRSPDVWGGTGAA
jgi:hypothetical protein